MCLSRTVSCLLLLSITAKPALTQEALQEDIEIEKSYFSSIDSCLFVEPSNIITNNNDTDLLNLDGKISVIFKITPITLYQHQVAMFQRLKNRFEKNGFRNLNFVLITSAENYDKNILNLFTKDISSYITNITVIAEEEDGDTGLIIRANQAIIVDQCQQLTYLVVPPWSFIEYPYVKAAVLSTIYDNPCTCEYSSDEVAYPVDTYYMDTSNDTTSDDRYSKMTTNLDFSSTNNEIEDPTPNEQTPNFNANNVSQTFLQDIEEMVREDMDSLDTDFVQNLQVLGEYPDSSLNEDIEDISNYVQQTNDSAEVETNDWGNFSFPLMKITLPVTHMHADESENGTSMYTKYHYIILQMGNPRFHEHYADDGEDLKRVSLADGTSTEAPTDNYIKSPVLEILKSKTDKVFVNEKGEVFRAIKEFTVNENTFDELQKENVDITQNVEIQSMPSEKQDELKRHYEKLVPWLSWHFKKY